MKHQGDCEPGMPLPYLEGWESDVDKALGLFHWNRAFSAYVDVLPMNLRFEEW